jgi:aquaporin Z
MEIHARKKYITEAIGTFILVFCGTGAIIINEVTGGTVSHIGIAMTFGLVVLALIYALGDISGAHFNPAVTFAFWRAKRFNSQEVLPYIASQTVGALLASGLLLTLFPQSITMGATLPAGSLLQSFILEVVLMFILMFVIINVSTGAKEKGITAAIAIGSVVGLEAMFAGPISGASMNPVRSLAPALVSGHFHALWIYLLAPFVGSLLAVLGCRTVKEAECCGGSCL